MTGDRPSLLPERSIDAFPQQVSVPEVSGVFLDHVDQHPAQRHRPSPGIGDFPGDVEIGRFGDEALRKGDLDGAESTFEDMEVVHDLLTSLDYPDGMTAGLRRTTDVARALIERSRADLTTTIVQERLRAQLEAGS